MVPYWMAKRVAACWGRQTGKTTIVAIKAIHFAIMNPGVLVLIVSPGIRQSMIMFGRIEEFMYDNPVLRATINRPTKTELRLNNRSRIIALPCSQDGATLRGFTADLVILDEAAFMPETVISNVIFPMLATTETTRGTGIAILISTPWGRNHIFYRITMNKKWYYSHVKSERSPIITASFLEDQREEIGDLRYRIEYEAEFVEDATQLFTTSILRGMIEYQYYAGRLGQGKPALLTDSEVLTRDRPFKGEFLMGLDLGKRRDYSVLQVWKKISRRVPVDPNDELTGQDVSKGVPVKNINNAWVLIYSKKFPLKTSYTQVVEPHTKAVYKQFNILGGYIDQTGVGESVVEAILPDCPTLSGVILTLQAKHRIMMWYYSMCERLRVAIPDDRVLIGEHLEQTFGYSNKRVRSLEEVLKEEGLMRFGHPDGRHDDSLWAAAMAIYYTSGEAGEWAIL